MCGRFTLHTLPDVLQIASSNAVRIMYMNLTVPIDDYVQDCLRYRVPPGQGEMHAVEFVTELIEQHTAGWARR